MLCFQMIKKFYLLVLLLVINSTALDPPAFVVNLPKERGPQTVSCRTVTAHGPQALVPGAARAAVAAGLLARRSPWSCSHTGHPRLCSEPGRAGWGSVRGTTLTKGQFVLHFPLLLIIYYIFFPRMIWVHKTHPPHSWKSLHFISFGKFIHME